MPRACIGIVVQPKFARPVYLLKDLNRTIEIYTSGVGGEVFQGKGYLEDTDGDPEYLLATQATGYPRAHTPEGVKQEGMGFGTCLYTGLLCLATAHAEGWIAIPDLAGEGDAICSDEESRSLSATQWWQAAYGKGLTQIRNEVVPCSGDCVETQTEENVDLVQEYGRGALKRSLASEYPEVTYVNEVDVDIEREVELEDKEIRVDIYDLGRAQKKNLIACIDIVTGAISDWMHSTRLSGDGSLVDPEVILALDVSAEPAIAVRRLAILAASAGAKDHDVERMLLRSKYALDLSTFRQKIPGLVEMRANRPRVNPADASELERALAELAERRAEMGWSDLEDLP